MWLALWLPILLAQATPAPSPDASCNRAAEIVKSAYPIPDQLPEDGQPLYATIGVDIAPNGSVEKTTILKSSGNISFDLASERAARQSEYKPKMVNCTAVEGAAIFKTSFTPSPP